MITHRNNRRNPPTRSVHFFDGLSLMAGAGVDSMPVPERFDNPFDDDRGHAHSLLGVARKL